MADGKTVDKAALDKAFDALKTYDWGTDRNALNPIDNAVALTYGDAAARKDIETRLLAALPTGNRDVKDFVCRTLKTMGTVASVPALAALLADKDNSHMARYALERIQAPEAGKALVDALAKVTGALKVGVVGSLGARGDAAAVAAVAPLLTDADKAVACAAACALGDLGTPEAGTALLAQAKTAPEGVKAAVADGCLVCAEHLLAAGKKPEATALYTALAGEDQPKHVRLAATRGMVAVAGKKE
jgi:HEAT repeat protein